MPNVASFDAEPTSGDDVASVIGECLAGQFAPEVEESLQTQRDGWVRIRLSEILQPARRQWFDDSCAILAPVDQLDRLKHLDVYRIGEQAVIRDACIVIARCDVRGMIGIGRSDARLFFGENVSANIDVRAWRNSKLFVGRNATINGARIVLDDVAVGIGDDAMLSDEILIQAGDQHSIWSLETMAVINQKQKPILIGEHTWIGRRATIMAGAAVGCGAIVGAGSTVTDVIDQFGVAVGSPAKVVKRGVTWSRNINFMSPAERAFLARRGPAGLSTGGFDQARRRLNED